MVELRDVAARGARIRFGVLGDGPPALLVHDALSDRGAWDAVIEPLAEKMRVIVPDLPGFGESEKPPPSRYAYTYDAYAESLVDLASSLDLGRVSVCGHGLGAAIAVMLAARHAAIVDRVVLVSPAIYAAPGVIAAVATVPVVGSFLFKQILGKAIFRRHFGWKIPEARVDRLYDSFSEPAARAAAHATLSMMRDPRPVIARLSSVRAPSLVVGGRDDAQFVAHGRRLARQLGGRYEVLECGRAPHEEHPDAFAKVAAAFLNEPKKRPRRSRGRAA